jgi:hypothetical protein
MANDVQAHLERISQALMAQCEATVDAAMMVASVMEGPLA